MDSYDNVGVLNKYFPVTRIISNELDQNTFKFSEFYKRRIRGILPALVLVKIIRFNDLKYFINMRW